jgi:hypothetical protein
MPPVDRTVPAVPEGSPVMLDATLWQVDMGDGTWAVCCLACQTLLYRGPKPIADLVFDTHGCEPVLPLTTRRSR